VFRRQIECTGCDYVGVAKMSWLGIALWVLSILLFVLSFAFWPLFLVWPILVIFLLIYPVGQVCPQCYEQGRRAAPTRRPGPGSSETTTGKGEMGKGSGQPR
jgi:hypothetical protein